MGQILDPAAAERMSRLRMVKEDKVRMIEDMLIQQAKAGKLQGQVKEQQLIEMLEGLDEQMGGVKVTFQRKGNAANPASKSGLDDGLDDICNDY
jgi:programmed cell death protein 5